VGATFGHSSSSNYGAEIGYRINAKWQIFIEAGHMGNITSADAESRANKLATALGTTANVVQKGNYGDAGVRYRLMDSGRWHVYATTGIGATSVDTETSFASGGTNVALGSDLSGHVTKTFFVVGGGVTTPITSKIFGDLSYRFGRIFPNTGAIEDDKGINTQRLQVGIGFRF
jgi:opacity protein-like surface antigen